jgi:hypothetical protein
MEASGLSSNFAYAVVQQFVDSGPALRFSEFMGRVSGDN